MSVAFVRGNSSWLPSNGTTNTCTFPSNTAGNLLVVAVEIADAASATVTDTAGNIWQTAFIQFPNIGYGLRLFYAENCLASAGTNTVTLTTSQVAHCDMCLAEYSGVATSLSYSEGAQSPNSYSVTLSPIVSGDLIVAFGFSATAVGAGLTSRGGPRPGVILADGASSGTSFTVNMTGSGGSMYAVAFHASPAPDEGLYKGGDFSLSDGGPGTYTESATFVSNTAGNLLLAFLGFNSPSGSLSATVSDTAGNTWSLVTSTTVAGGSEEFSIAVYSVASCLASSGKNTVTATFTLSAFSKVRLWIAEYANTPITSSATANAIISGAITASVSSTVGALVVAGTLASAGAIQAAVGYSGRKTDGAMMIEDGTATSNPATPSTTNVGSTAAVMIALSIGSGLQLAQPFVWVVF